MRPWSALIAAALEGTTRSTGSGPVQDDPQRRLLSEAAWHTLVRLAGQKAQTFTGTSAVEAPAESLPLVSRAAASRLEEILRSDDREHIGEWLDLAARARKRVPPSLLPSLLERGAEKSELRGTIIATGGARLGWLAAQNEEWAYAAIADPAEAFSSGIRAARAAALGLLRRQDPAAALALLAAGWSKEGGDDRVALIHVLAIGLGPGDEPFLTEATTDGRKEVRTAAADLLARLPTSVLIGRMTARADSWIRFKKGMLGGKLEVIPPTECTPEMVADGIEPKPPKGVGERAFWLRQVVALVPPSHWSPAIFDAALKTDWAQPLLDGWTAAAVRFGDAQWCEVLLEHYVGVKERYQVQASMRSLIRALPRAALEDMIERQMRRSPRIAIELAAMSEEWFTARLSTTLFAALEQEFRRGQKQQDYWLSDMTRTLKRQLDPSVLPEVVASVDRATKGDASPAAEAFQAMAATLEYRAEMAKEIAN
jgi:Family of unknown function (DUF5691)